MEQKFVFQAAERAQRPNLDATGTNFIILLYTDVLQSISTLLTPSTGDLLLNSLNTAV